MKTRCLSVCLYLSECGIITPSGISVTVDDQKLSQPRLNYTIMTRANANLTIRIMLESQNKTFKLDLSDNLEFKSMGNNETILIKHKTAKKWTPSVKLFPLILLDAAMLRVFYLNFCFICEAQPENHLYSMHIPFRKINISSELD